MIYSQESRPTVVFLHGVFMSPDIWDPVVDRLPPGDTIVLHMPGHGATPLTRGMTLEDHAQSVADVLDARGIKSALFVGHSWGGMLTVLLASDRPDLVAGAVLANTPLLRTRRRARLGFLAQKALLNVGLPPSTYGSLAARALHGPDYLASHPETATRMSERVAGMGRTTVRRVIDQVILGPNDLLPALLELDIPLAVIAGEEDYVLKDGVAIELDGAGVEVRVVLGGHCSPVESPDEVARAIVDVIHKTTVGARGLITPSRRDGP